MTLEQLRALDAVVTCGSIRSASGKLHKTAPAISTLIKNLEADLSITLLDRESYRPTLTAQGEIFYAKALELLKHADELSSLSQRMIGRREVLVNIAVNAVCPLDVILNTLRGIEAKHPSTQINVSSEHMGGAMERLTRQEADIAITTTQGMDHLKMEAVLLLELYIIPVAHRDYSLAQLERLITRKEAKRHTQVIVRDSSREDEKQSLDVIEGGRHCHVTDFPAKKAIISAGLGWGGLPEHLITQELESGELRSLSVEGFEPRRSQQFLIRRTDGKQGPVSQDIWIRLKEEFNHPSPGN